MEYGVSIGPQGELSENLQNAPEVFKFVEMPLGELERDLSEIDEEEIKKILEEKCFNLIVHLPFGQPVVTQIDKFNSAEIEYLKEVIEFSRTLGAEKAVLHPNIRYREDPEDVKEEFKTQLKKLEKFASNQGIELCVENMPPQINCAANNFELAEILEDLDISMCFDTGHGYASMGQEEMEEFLKKHSDIISHLHLQDTREGEDMHLPVGCAQIEFESIGEIMKDFNGTATLEVFTGDNDYKKLSLDKARNMIDE